MSDLGLRARARAAAVGGPVEAAGLLRERVRAGEVDPEELELAAYLGHPAARELSSARPTTDAIPTWVRGLSRWGDELPVRAAVACAWLVLPLWEDPEERPPEQSRRGYCCEWCTPGGWPSVDPTEDLRPREAATLAEAWLADPTAPTETLEAAARNAADAASAWEVPWSGRSAALACAHAAEAAALAESSGGLHPAATAVVHAVAALRRGWCYEYQEVWRFTQEAIASCLVPWAV